MLTLGCRDISVERESSVSSWDGGISRPSSSEMNALSLSPVKADLPPIGVYFSIDVPDIGLPNRHEVPRIWNSVIAMKVGGIYLGGELLISRVWRADTTSTRIRGLLGRAPLQANEGLMIVPCNAIHTFGMKYKLDVVFLDFADRVVKMVYHLDKWRIALSGQAKWVLELRAGEAERLNLKIGEELKWRQG